MTLAKESGGWGEDFIRLQLPLSRALQYRHVIYRRRGLWTLPAAPPAQTQLATLKSKVAGLLGNLASKLNRQPAA